jgi:hypothetical protein
MRPKMNLFLNQITKQKLFKHNKYSKWYYNIIENALNRDQPSEYTELHHIIPFCISQSNDKNNLVRLTGREHFIAHLLLIKAITKKNYSSMTFAIRKMLVSGPGQSRVVSSRTFAIARKLFAAEQSKRMTKFWSDPVNRKNHSEKLKAILSTSASRELKRTAALKSSTPEVVAKRAAGHRGLKHSEETKQKMRLAYQRRIGNIP